MKTAPQVEPLKEGQPSNAQVVQAVEAWKYLDFLCHNYVLNGLVDSLYNVYCKTNTTKELRESLERKYKTKDVGTKKFMVAHFLDYKVVGSKNVISHVQDWQLPSSWVEFKNFLKHKRKEMSVKDLVVHLRIEEDNKLAQKNTYTPDSAMANMVEHVVSSSKSKRKGKGKNDKGRLNAKLVTPRQANMVNDNVDMIVMVSDVIAMISEVNMAAVDNEEKLYMDISTTDDIKGERDVILKMTSEKELKLTNSDKFVLSKNQMYVGKGYSMNGMFKLNVKVVMNDINKMNSSAYLIESSNAWHDQFENQLGRKIKVVQSDKGGEYMYPFTDLYAKHRIKHEFTAPYSPQQNENEPTSYQEAVTSSEGTRWKEAIKSETDSILQNHIWELVDLPPGYKPLGYKWIFKKKMKADGTIDKYKARLGVKGFRQCEGLEYFDTYSPVTRITSIRKILAIVALRNLEVHQIDVKTAFLNGDLEETIFDIVCSCDVSWKRMEEYTKICSLNKEITQV
ncbi:retrovirus-related pol polyprotein from transposon TNT 1-94 [Tanacetum coccineum]|uniref:Retrovirus-related pol polyprotein from transposon TNT 1-94 n=1 Tax=Tanacetum coccineum TaxID=301880 RepID=A0ABQ5HX72_9ASTR